MPRMTFCWPEGRAGAVTTSWDDGTVFDRRLVAVLNERGLKGTFNLNSAFLGYSAEKSGWKEYVRPDEVAALYQGHEVACHASHHPHLHREPDEQILAQVLEDRRALERLVSYPVRGMALPFAGTVDSRVHSRIVQAGIRYLRWLGPESSLAAPGDFLHWQASGHYSGFGQLWEKFRQDRAPDKLLYLWGHSYEFDENGSWHVLESLAAQAGAADDLWLATNGDIFDYVMAWRSLVCSVDGSLARNASCVTLWYRVDGELRSLSAGAAAINGRAAA